MTSAVISVNCAATDQRLRRPRCQFCMNDPTIAHPNLQRVYPTMVPDDTALARANANKMTVIALLASDRVIVATVQVFFIQAAFSRTCDDLVAWGHWGGARGRQSARHCTA